MQAAIAQTEARFGKIHGVIHAAGVVDKESLTAISETGYTECELHFQPKVYGVYTLEKVLRGRELDYCVLISSVSSILDWGLLPIVQPISFWMPLLTSKTK
jgi:NAD(P)-dependent dehydrogenase (short-subunit alcohol dehydrogenase family)